MLLSFADRPDQSGRQPRTLTPKVRAPLSFFSLCLPGSSATDTVYGDPDHLILGFGHGVMMSVGHPHIEGENMLPRIMKIGFLMWLGAFLLASPAFAKTNTLRLTQDVVLTGGQTLKAGNYTVMVNEKMDQIQFFQNSKLMAKHACTCTHVQKKNSDTQVVIEQGPGDALVLQQIRLKGEAMIISLTS
jgi:hypothetical protein